MNSTSRSKSTSGKSSKQSTSFVLMKSKRLLKLDESKKSGCRRLCGLGWLKDKLSCCTRRGTESPTASLKDFKLTAPASTKLKQTLTGAHKGESDKIKPKLVGDFRKTLVLEVNNLLVYFQPKEVVPTQIQLMASRTGSIAEPKSKRKKYMPQNELVEVQPIIRNDLPMFLKELNEFYEIIFWTTMPKKVQNRVTCLGDGDYYE